MRRTLPALALAASLPVLPASAATELDPIVVTPTRSAAPLSDALASTSVLTRADLDRTQAQSLIEAVSRLPGVGYANNGGDGAVSSLFVRGTESRHIAVFVDGVKLGSATTGTVALQDIPLAQVERIELVRGPLSGLYGSDAVGGTLHIITRKGAGFGASATLGSRDTRRASANFGLGDDALWLSAGASVDDTDGFNACDTRSGTDFKACFANEPDRDGYRNRAFNLAAGARLGAATRLTARALVADGKLDFDGGFVNEGETRQQVLSASLAHTFSPAWTTRFAVAQSRDESRNFKDGAFMTRFDTRFDQLSWENVFALGDAGSVTLGVDHYDEAVTSTTTYTVPDRQTTGVFAQWRGALGGFATQANLRHDDNSQFGGHTTGGLALGRDLSDALSARVSVGTAFKAPTFNDLYFPDSPPFFFSNPDLQPESSTSYEAGLDGRFGGGGWSLAVFRTDIDDLIVFAGTTPTNNARARIDGVEAAVRWAGGGWRVDANLTVQDPENRSAGANNGNQLARRARHMANLDVSREFGDWSVGGSVRAVGKRWDNVANTDRLDAYAVVDLTAETRIARDWRLAVKLENLADREYETAYYYHQPGRGVFVTLGYQLPK